MRELLTIAGVPVGKELGDRASGSAEIVPTPPDHHDGGREWLDHCYRCDRMHRYCSHQLERVARRVPMGLARGSAPLGANGSGDIFIAFSTAKSGRGQSHRWKAVEVSMLPNGEMDPIFLATIQATEESIVNALVAAKTMTGINGHAPSMQEAFTRHLEGCLTQVQPPGRIARTRAFRIGNYRRPFGLFPATRCTRRRSHLRAAAARVAGITRRAVAGSW